MREELRAKIEELQGRLEAFQKLSDSYKQVWEIEATDDWGRAEVLAGEGWELVSVTTGLQDRNYGAIHTYFFKRPKWVEKG